MDHNLIQAQVALLAVHLELAATYKETQKSPVDLPEELGLNEQWNRK